MRRRIAILGVALAILLGWVAGRSTAPHVAPPPAAEVAAPAAEPPPLGAMPRTVDLVESDDADPDADPVVPYDSVERVAGEIRGLVLDPVGRPKRTKVFLFGTSDWRGPQMVRTDAQGKFRFVPDGDLSAPFWISVPPSGAGWADCVAVTPGAETTTVTLRAYRKVRVTVLDDGGKPVDAWVRFDGAGGSGESRTAHDEARAVASPTDYSSADTDKDGVAVLEVSRADRRGELFVHPNKPEDGERRYLDHEDSRWLPRACTIRLRPNLSVKGIVRDGAGLAQSDGEIAWRAGDGPWSVGPLEDDGTFWITDLPPGPVVLEPRFPDLGLPDDAFRKVVEAGARDVVLTVDLSTEIAVRVEGWPSEAANGYALLSATGPDAGPRPFRSPIDARGVARFRGVTPGTPYALFVPCSTAELVEFGPEGDVHRIVLREGLTTGAAVTTVKLIAGQSLGGRVDLSQVPEPERADVLRTTIVSVADGPVRASCRPDGDGAFEIRGLPEGTWTVEAQDDSVAWSARGETRTANTSPLVLTLTRSTGDKPETRSR